MLLQIELTDNTNFAEQLFPLTTVVLLEGNCFEKDYFSF